MVALQKRGAVAARNGRIISFSWPDDEDGFRTLNYDYYALNGDEVLDLEEVLEYTDMKDPVLAEYLRQRFQDT